jgi:hypothetical protein
VGIPIAKGVGFAKDIGEIVLDDVVRLAQRDERDERRLPVSAKRIWLLQDGGQASKKEMLHPEMVCHDERDGTICSGHITLEIRFVPFLHCPS